MTNTPIAAKLAAALRKTMIEMNACNAQAMHKGYKEGHTVTEAREAAREALREYDDAKGREDQPVAQAWLPIESAPKDGTRVLLYSTWDGIITAKWKSTKDGFGDPVIGWIATGETDELGPCAIDDAVMWMPLPQPPQSAPASLTHAKNSPEAREG